MSNNFTASGVVWAGGLLVFVALSFIGFRYAYTEMNTPQPDTLGVVVGSIMGIVFGLSAVGVLKDMTKRLQ